MELHTCSRCGDLIPPSPGKHTTGYGIDADGNKICYRCCGELDKANMVATGKATLYLTFEGNAKPGQTIYGRGYVTNWPGSIKFATGSIRVGRHNIAGRRYDTWFNGPDHHVWHAVQYGDDTQIAHCRRTKETWGI